MINLVCPISAPSRPAEAPEVFETFSTGRAPSSEPSTESSFDDGDCHDDSADDFDGDGDADDDFERFCRGF